MRGGKRDGAGRKKGTPNKFTAQLKDMILEAAEQAGNDIEPGEGTVAYLKKQAKDNPGPFMSLLGKVMPTQLTGDPDSPISVVTRIERHIIDPEDRDAADIRTASEEEEV